MSEQSFVIKDSGARATFQGGMVRDVADGKTNYLLVRDGPMYRRWAEHLTKGAKKYSARNWMKACDQEALDRALESADRHFTQWVAGETDEDHAAAVMFNINQVEYIRARMMASGCAGASGAPNASPVSPGSSCATPTHPWVAPSAHRQ